MQKNRTLATRNLASGISELLLLAFGPIWSNFQFPATVAPNSFGWWGLGFDVLINGQRAGVCWRRSTDMMHLYVLHAANVHPIHLIRCTPMFKGFCFGVSKSRWVEVEVEVCECGQGRALSSISALEGVIISHPGVTGAKTVIWREGSRAKPEGGCCREVERVIRRRTWREGALKPCPGTRAKLSPGVL